MKPQLAHINKQTIYFNIAANCSHRKVINFGQRHKLQGINQDILYIQMALNYSARLVVRPTIFNHRTAVLR